MPAATPRSKRHEEGKLKVSRWIALCGVVALAAVAVTATALGNATPTSQKASIKAALVSDIAGFNDNGFNKNQLKGLNRAVKKTGGTAIPLISHSASDYNPNFNQAIRQGAKVVVAAGYLLAPTMKIYSKKFPSVDFAITDDSYKDAGGGKNVEGLTYATQEGGCLVGVLAAKMAQKLGGNKIGAVGGIKIPPVDSYIAGYKYCAAKAVPGTTTVVQYSNNFDDPNKCQPVAQNEIGQGVKVLFQVAGGCGLGVLKAADAAKLWGIGVDADEYNDAKRDPDERGQEDRRRCLRRGHAVGRRHVPRRQRPAAQPEEQRRRRRPDQPVRAEVVDRADERLQGEDHRRHAQAAGDAEQVTNPARSGRDGPSARPSRPRYRIAPNWRPRTSSR